MRLSLNTAAIAAITFTLAPSAALACACGCGVFDVGAGAMTPDGPGGVASLEYDFMDQNRNHSGTSSAPAADNPDKQIRTSFVTLSLNYTVAPNWSVMAQVPVWDRQFRTDDGGGVQGFHHTALGDVRLQATYTGLFKDMSTGVSLGLKLPTGDFKYAGFDRDTEIGSGSTDLLIGAYHVGQVAQASPWSYFIQAQGQIPFTSQGGYTPGAEVNAAVGVHYDDLSFASGKIKLTPSLQVIASARAKDSGINANPDGSGYSRVQISPGLALSSGNWKLYADVEFPIYQQVRGDQLVAPELFKVALSRRF